MANAQKPDFLFRQNKQVHLNQRGRQFSRLLAAEVCASAVVMLDTPCSEIVWRFLATHSIRHFPLHFPSLRHCVASHFYSSLPSSGNQTIAISYKTKLDIFIEFIWHKRVKHLKFRYFFVRLLSCILIYSTYEAANVLNDILACLRDNVYQDSAQLHNNSTKKCTHFNYLTLLCHVNCV